MAVVPARALITGATAGIGRATAELFAAQGIEVGVLAESPPEVDETVAAITASGGSAFPVHADLLRSEQVTGLIDRLEADGIAIDVLVNNAGIGLQADVLDTQDEDLRRLFEVNYFAAFLLGRDVLRHMARRGQGHIINVSSAAARRSLPGMAVYASTKAAVHSLSQALRIEAADSGVRVTEILPISVRTRFFAAATNRADREYAPSGRADTPESIARLILGAVQHPTPEVYTSPLVRLVLALDALTPKILDAVILARRRRQTPPPGG
jgi:short-subunit dehydrogenase